VSFYNLKKKRYVYVLIKIIIFILQIILLFLSCVLRKRISFMAALFKESAKCLRELPGLFFQPVLTFISLMLFFAFWVFVILCLATASKYFTINLIKKLDYFITKN